MVTGIENMEENRYFKAHIKKKIPQEYSMNAAALWGRVEFPLPHSSYGWTNNK